MLHPAAALRRPELRKTLVEDFRAIADILEADTLPETIAPEPEGEAPKEPPAEQLGIFGAPSASPPASPGNATEELADAPAPEPPGRDDGPQQLSLL